MPMIGHVSFGEELIKLQRSVDLNGSPREFPLFTSRAVTIYEEFAVEVTLKFHEDFLPRGLKRLTIKPINNVHGLTFEAFSCPYNIRDKLKVRLQAPSGTNEVKLVWQTPIAMGIAEDEEIYHDHNQEVEHMQENDDDEEEHIREEGEEEERELNDQDMRYDEGFEEEVDDRMERSGEGSGGEGRGYAEERPTNNTEPIMSPRESRNAEDRIIKPTSPSSDNVLIDHPHHQHLHHQEDHPENGNDHIITITFASSPSSHPANSSNHLDN